MTRKAYIQIFGASGKTGDGYKQSIENTENEDLSTLCTSLPDTDSYNQTFGKDE